MRGPLGSGLVNRPQRAAKNSGTASKRKRIVDVREDENALGEDRSRISKRITPAMIIKRRTTAIRAHRKSSSCSRNRWISEMDDFAELDTCLHSPLQDCFNGRKHLALSLHIELVLPLV